MSYDWNGIDWDDLDAVQVWVLERRAYLDTVLAATAQQLRVRNSESGAAAS